MTGKIITVANWKGGVGKTTLAIAIADTLVSMHRHVSFFDLDAQATASRALLAKDQRQDKLGTDEFENRDRDDMNLYGLLSARLSIKRPRGRVADTSTLDVGAYRNDLVHFLRDAGMIGLRLYPNSSKLWALEASEAKENGGARLRAAVKALLLEESLAGRTVVVDCPPAPTSCTIAAMCCSDIVLCPTTPDQFAVWGRQEFRKYFDEHVSTIAPKVILRFIVTRHTEKGAEAQRILEVLRTGPAGKGPPEDMLCIEGGDNQKAAPRMARFSEREVVRRRLGFRENERRARSLKDIYGSPCAEELRHIVNAIFRELGADSSSLQSSGS